MKPGDTVWCIDRNSKIRRATLLEELKADFYKVRLEKPDGKQSEWFMKDVFTTELDAERCKSFKLLTGPTPFNSQPLMS